MDTTGTITKEVKDGVRATEASTVHNLELLLKENAHFERNRLRAPDELYRASLIKNPIDTETAVARLGILTGSIPLTALILKLLINSSGGPDAPTAIAFGALVSVSILITSATGYLSGKSAGHILRALEKKEWPLMLISLPIVGAIWGMLSGAAGGVVLFGIGAIFGGMLGLVIGAFAFTAFGILHRLLSHDDKIERNQLIPVSVGIAAFVAAIILGLP